MKQSSLAIVGLSQLFREGLQVLLRRSRFGVVISAATLDEALASMSVSRPELLVCAMSGPEDACARIEQLRLSRAQLDGVRIVILADQLGAEHLREAAAAGVQGVLSKDITSDVLQRSLELAMLGQPFFPGPAEQSVSRHAASLIPFSRPILAATLSHPPTLSHLHDAPNAPAQVKSLFAPATAGTAPQRNTALSERERQILRCLVDGAANKTIARNLQITEATVKVHIKGLLRKIRVTNRTQAAVWGLNNSTLLDDPATAPRDHSRDFKAAQQAAS